MLLQHTQRQAKMFDPYNRQYHLPNTSNICHHLPNPYTIDNRHAAYSGGTFRLSGGLSFWILYVNSARVPYVALPSLDGNNADLPQVAYQTYPPHINPLHQPVPPSHPLIPISSHYY